MIEEIDELLNHHTVLQIANILNERGVPSGTGRPFNAKMVARLQRNYCLKSRYDRLREAGSPDAAGDGRRAARHADEREDRNRRGLIRGHAYSDKNECLYDPPGTDSPRKAMGVKLSCRRRHPDVVSDRRKEV